MQHLRKKQLLSLLRLTKKLYDNHLRYQASKGKSAGRGHLQEVKIRSYERKILHQSTKTSITPSLNPKNPKKRKRKVSKRNKILCRSYKTG